MRGIPSSPGFLRFWAADAVSTLGTAISTLALQFLLIQNLRAGPIDLGLVRAAQWAPYLLIGLVAGVLVDRVRRRPVLVAMDVANAVVLLAIAVLALLGMLTVPVLAGLVFLTGAASTFYVAAHQSFLPRLVTAQEFPTATARIEQGWTAANSLGPFLAGALVSAFSAPVGIAVDGLSYAVSAVLLAGLSRSEPARTAAGDRHLWRELAEGARWVYRHPVLAPYAVSLHLWFFFSFLVSTVLVYYATHDLGLSSLAVGLVVASAGLSGILGAGLAPALQARVGLGRACVWAWWLAPLATALILLTGGGRQVLAVLVAAQLLLGLGEGIKSPLYMTYRNAVTPDRLRARMNGTIRAVNWGSITFAAPLGGWLAVRYGTLAAIAVGAAGLLLSALVITASPYRSAVLPAADEPATPAR